MVINSKHLSDTHILYSETERTSLSEYDRKKAAQIKRGDVLIYTTGAYIGLANTYNCDEKALASNHVNILRLKTSSVDSNYLALVINSIIGKLQIEKYSRGSAQLELYPLDIDKFLIPILEESEMKEIGDLVKSSLKSELTAKDLLDKITEKTELLLEEAASKKEKYRIIYE